MVESGGQSLTWEITESDGGAEVAFDGTIDEHAQLGTLGSGLTGSVVFHLGGVRRINSAGVHTWVNFVRALPATADLVFVHCSPAFVTQMNLIHGFEGAARVESFYAPFECEDCFHEQLKLFRTEQVDTETFALPPVACAECGGAMEFDEQPDRYLSFLRTR